MSDSRAAHATQALLQSGQQAMAQGQWAQAMAQFGLALQRQAHHAGAWHNLGVCALALGQAAVAEDACRRALALSPSLWQSQLVMGKAQKLSGDMMQADESFKAVLRSDASNAQARVALADLYMNTFGQPLTAVALVKPLLTQAEHAEDAELTTLMAGLYDRDTSAEAHNQGVMDFSSRSLQLDPARLAFLPGHHNAGRSELPLLRWGSVVYIEFIRGAPLITLLFLGQNILGFLLPGGLAPDRVWRAAWVLTFFAAAYVAEALRSGLAAVPRGQLEAAQSLGMTMPQSLVQVVLPQALRVALPAVVGQFITLLQDTTLLSLIGLLDLLGTARAVMANPAFLGKSAEVYLVLAVLFWCCCAALGLGSRALETRLNPSDQTRYQR